MEQKVDERERGESAAGREGSGTNQRPVIRSCDHSGPIRGQYSGHVITLDQSEASNQVMGSLWTNQRLGKGLGYLKPASRFYKVFAVSTECEN